MRHQFFTAIMAPEIINPSASKTNGDLTNLDERKNLPTLVYDFNIL
jgi:hypothetical protein